MSNYEFLKDLVENTRHAIMQIRRAVKSEDVPALVATPRKLIEITNREADALQLTPEDKKAVEDAVFLQCQCESAMVYLFSVDNFG